LDPQRRRGPGVLSIVGTGYDQTELERIRDAVNRFGDRFLRRCFTEEEIRLSFLHRDPVPRLAARYAAKEAASKALGTGIARGVLWKEIEVRRVEGEAPRLFLHGRAGERAQLLGAKAAHVSLTHARQ